MPLNVNEKYELLKDFVDDFEKQNSINPSIYIMLKSETYEEKEFLTDLLQLVFFKKGEE